jgi:glucose/arabinose dehydrogenase
MIFNPHAFQTGRVRRLTRTCLAVCFLCLSAFGLAACGSGGASPTETPLVTLASPPGASPLSTSGPALAPETAVPNLPQAAPTESANLPATQAPQASATTGSVTGFPDPGGFDWVKVADGLENPVGLANAGDGSGRLLVVEQPGSIRILRDGSVLSEPFLDIRERVDCCGERGLLGLAFHPNYLENGYFYVNYTDRNGDTVIARFSVSSDDPNRADPDSEKQLILIDQPYPNHNGGSTVFGPDGYLYLGLGDGGSGGDPQGNAQNPAALLGKILRLDVDGGEPYAIPPDNPFVGGDGAPEVWAYGLRNPWRMSFDRLSGDLYIGDVGQNRWEEIDYLLAGSPGGANFGWNYYEGMHPYLDNPPDPAQFIFPVAEYGHDQGISVTGGYVYRGAEIAEFQGIYLYGDYGSGLVWGLLRTPDGGWQNQQLFKTGLTLTSFGEDESGEVYLTDWGGSVYRLTRR